MQSVFQIPQETFSLSKKVDKEEIKKRSKKLRDLGKDLEKEYREKFKGKDLEVVVENINGKRIKGKSQYFFDVWFEKNKIISKKKPSKNLIGKVIKIKY